MGKGSNIPKKLKKGTPPPIDKLLKPAIGVALALIIYQFVRGLGAGVRRNRPWLAYRCVGASSSHTLLLLCTLCWMCCFATTTTDYPPGD
jgi:hypothetical protein